MARASTPENMNEEFECSRESDSESCSSNHKPERTPEHNPEEHHKPEPVKWTLKVLKQEAKEKGIKKYSKMNKEANETALGYHPAKHEVSGVARGGQGGRSPRAPS